MLSIAFEEIPEGGTELSEDLGPEWIGSVVGSQYREAGTPMHVEFSLTRAGVTVVARGRIRGTLVFACSRCAEDRPLSVSHDFTHVFVKGTHAENLPEGADSGADTEYTFTEDGGLDLEPVAAEELILSLPTFPLCSEDCKGVCQHCGLNLNEGACTCRVDVADPRWQKLRDINL